jgi:diguanylate cyclase (GGDEF)-like protein
MLAALVAFWGLRQVLDGWPYLPSYAGDAIRELLERAERFALLLWSCALLSGLAMRRHRPDSAAYMHLVIQCYAVTIAGFVYLAGPFYSPGWMFFVGGAVLGFLLFGRYTLIGIASFFLVLIAVVLAGHHGLPPESSALAQSTDWTQPQIHMGLTSAIFAVITLGLCGYLIFLLRDREARLEQLSRVDPLTGALNRRHFAELLDREFKRAERYGTPLTCIMVDLDHFKKVNDEHGHVVGDSLLMAVAAALWGGLREHDAVVRYGGEEFALLLPNTSGNSAREVAERCRRLVAATEIPRPGHHTPVCTTASLGVAAFPEDARTSGELVETADRALYRAKQAGRNRVTCAGDTAAVPASISPGELVASARLQAPG